MATLAKLRSRIAIRSRIKRLFKKKKRPGSGLPARPVIRRLVWARRVAQTFFFGLFCWLLFETGFRGNFAATDARVRVEQPVEGFLLADPFVAAMTVLSTHTVYRGLLWSVGIIALTVVFGRVFCGWICPFGTMHHFFAWIFPSRYSKGKSRITQNKTHPVRQRIKYYILYASLAAALAGSAIGGLLDPICIAVRSIGLTVLPVMQYAAHVGTDAAGSTNVRAVQSASDAMADVMAAHVYQSKQFYFHETWLIGILLLGVLFMNRFIPRFWCRVLCPLGALLGVFSRFALFGMEKDHAKCTDCDSLRGALPRRRQPPGWREVAAGRVPHVPQLRDRLPGGRHQVPLPSRLPQSGGQARHRPTHRARERRRRAWRSSP